MQLWRLYHSGKIITNFIRKTGTDALIEAQNAMRYKSKKT